MDYKEILIQSLTIGTANGRGTQRGYSSKPLNISIVERILVFKR